MTKTLNLFILALFFFSSFFLLSTNANSQLDSTIYSSEESNCCIADVRKPCEIFDKGTDAKYICECELDFPNSRGDQAQNALVNGCLDLELLDSSLYDSTIWGSDHGGGAGCDDNSCESAVCEFDPFCCEEEWDEQCAEEAALLCGICGGGILDFLLTSDEDPLQLYSYIDLRNRDSFVQVTNLDAGPTTVHVQIFDVNNNCNENNFYDVYTANDTHIYNMSDITRNDGNPSGVVLPDDAYGIVVITVVDGVGGPTLENSVIVGNFRIIDNSGYEYRTNMLGIRTLTPFPEVSDYFFNYNVRGNITLSDVVGINILQNQPAGEVIASPQSTYAAFDIDIYNENEVPFSCRDIIFACIDEDSNLQESILESVGVGSVASFEYGINNAIPHSKGGELLCPGNTISDGIVVLRPESTNFDNFVMYIGLNDGNGRGSMDSYWFENLAPFVAP